ncbi:MAG TPA: nucleoside diphosphate kinase regulator [Terriglobales bacterium]|nr:nucleoside diphosphate kinase regulator [Terriglobales bacterium]
MKANKIMISATDLDRLRRLIDSSRRPGHRDADNLDALEFELDRAVVRKGATPSGVVALGSWVRMRDLDSERELSYQIVLPKHANVEEKRISVLAPIGTALLGCRVGSIVEWTVPSGERRFKILEVQHQTESEAVAA